MHHEDLKVLQAKLSHTQEALLEEIGSSLALTEGFDIKGLRPGELRSRAERWLELHEANFVNKICKEWHFSEKMKDPRYQDNLVLASAIADLIAGSVTKVAPFTVAAFLVKRGLEKLCG